MTAGGVAGHGLNLRQTRPQTESTAGSGPALSHFRECPSPTDVPATLRMPAANQRRRNRPKWKTKPWLLLSRWHHELGSGKKA